MPTDEEYQKQLDLSSKEETQVTPATAVGEGPQSLELAIAGKAQQVPLETEVPVQHNGQLLKVPLSKILNHYRQRADLEGKWQEFKGLKTAFEQERGEYDEFLKKQKELEPYQQLQKWSQDLEKTNPSGFQYLQNTINKIKNMGISGDSIQAEEGSSIPGIDIQTLNQTLTGLRSQLDGFNAWKNEIETKEQQRQEEKDWQDVQREVEEFRKEFPEINLDETDPEGTKLWAKIVDWGTQKGYQDFIPAAYAFFGSRLKDTLLQRGRNEAVKGIQKDASKGIVARSSTPFPSEDGQSAKVDPKKLSYDQLEEAALAALQNTPAVE